MGDDGRALEGISALLENHDVGIEHREFGIDRVAVKAHDAALALGRERAERRGFVGNTLMKEKKRRPGGGGCRDQFFGGPDRRRRMEAAPAWILRRQLGGGVGAALVDLFVE